MIRNGDAMRVRRQICEHVLRPAERRLHIRVPVGLRRLRQEEVAADPGARPGVGSCIISEARRAGWSAGLPARLLRRPKPLSWER
jgi:hypothetical protein